MAALLLSLFASWSHPSHAQPAPAGSEQEAERRHLLEQLGLKKGAGPGAPRRAPEDAGDRQRKEADPDGPSKADGAAPRDESGTEVKTAAAAGLVFSGTLHRTLLGACGSCHGSAGSAARSSFLLNGTLEVDFAAARRHVNPGQPESSPLLRLASGSGHAGGAIFTPGSAEHQLLARWIGNGAKQGAPNQPLAQTPIPSAARAITPVPRPDMTAAGALPHETAAAPVSAAPAGVATAQALAGGERLAYAPDIHEALSQACAGCHRAGAMAGGTGYVLSGEAAMDYASARRFVDLARPEHSPLLTKASGELHAGGAPFPPGSPGHVRLSAWLRAGAWGPIVEATVSAAPPASDAMSPGPLGAALVHAPVLPAAASRGSSASPHAEGLSLPFQLRLNGRFDLNYERRNFDTQPFSSGDDALQSYHHFVFLSRQTQDDPVGFSAELVNLSFWEVNYRMSLPGLPGPLWIKAGKLLVPFGSDPLFHQSYGGLVGFDQRVLPAIWAQEGLSGRLLLEQGDLSASLDLYALRGHELRQRDAVLNLQSDFSPLDSSHIALGGRVRASWKALSVFYSGYFNRLGFARQLYLQAADVGVWRLRGVPVLKDMAAELGLLRADISGAGAGQDYFHFASYFRLRYYLTDLTYVQYRQGLRTFDNRRGVILDDSRLTREDGSTHGFGLVTRHGPLTFGLYYYFNLEKADEVDDDFLRVTGVYEF